MTEDVNVLQETVRKLRESVELNERIIRILLETLDKRDDELMKLRDNQKA